MSHSARKQVQATPSCQLLRKSDLLKKVAFSKSTLHAKMAVGGPYHDPAFPLPFYFPKSRTPFWRESDVDAWIEKSAYDFRKATKGTVAAVESSPALLPDAAMQPFEMPPQSPRLSDTIRPVDDKPMAYGDLSQSKERDAAYVKRGEVRLNITSRPPISLRNVFKREVQEARPHVEGGILDECILEVSKAQPSWAGAPAPWVYGPSAGNRFDI